MTAIAARAGVALTALLLLAWLGVMERDARLRASGVAAAGQGSFARAESDLRAARLLSPDTTPDVDRALLYFGAGRRGEGVALLEDVARREPENRTAWFLLYGFTRESDPAVAARAESALRRLDPVNARRR